MNSNETNIVGFLRKNNVKDKQEEQNIKEFKKTSNKNNRSVSVYLKGPAAIKFAELKKKYFDMTNSDIVNFVFNEYIKKC